MASKNEMGGDKAHTHLHPRGGFKRPPLLSLKSSASKRNHTLTPRPATNLSISSGLAHLPLHFFSKAEPRRGLLFKVPSQSVELQR